MSQPPSRDERRKSPRVVVDAPVRLTIGAQGRLGRLHDICRDAALVEIQGECGVGSVVELVFELDEEDGPIQISGTVIRVVPGDGDTRAVAVLFRNVQPTAEGQIDRFLSRQSG